MNTDGNIHEAKKKQAKLGGWEGKGFIADDFDESMDEDEYGRFESDPDYCKPVKEVSEK